MKKAGKIIGNIILGLAFAIAVWSGLQELGFWDHSFEQGEDEIKEVKISPVERKVYKLGEDAVCDDLIWNIAKAEIKDYENLDDYYKNRKHLLPPMEICKEPYYGMFAEEIKYLFMKGTVTNTSKYAKRYSFERIKLYNRFEDGTFEEARNTLDAIRDYKFISENENVSLTEDFFDPVTIESGETAEFEYVIQFSEYDTGYGPDYLYDLYLSTQGLYPTSGSVILEEKIDLGIEPRNSGMDKITLQNTYEEQRDIVGMKCRQWINAEIKQYQEEGYPMLYYYETEEDMVEEKVTDENIVFTLWKEYDSQITGVKVTNWEGVKQYAPELTRLDEMAESYAKAGYDKDQLKILLLDIDYSRIEIDPERDNHSFNFYENSYLFTRDKQGKRWIFGNADDWTVLKNSVENGRTGHINIEAFAEGQTVGVQAAYLLPPEIYEEGALYFCGGKAPRYNREMETIQRIPLVLS